MRRTDCILKGQVETAVSAESHLRLADALLFVEEERRTEETSSCAQPSIADDIIHDSSVEEQNTDEYDRQFGTQRTSAVQFTDVEKGTVSMSHNQRQSGDSRLWHD